MQITFFIKIKFWLKDLEVKCYEDHMNESRMKDKRYKSL